MAPFSASRVRSFVNLMLALSALLLCKPTEAAQTELLSIQGLSIAKNEYVDTFEIHTWGVELLAVCHLPTPAWRITVGSDGTPEGILSGEGGVVGAAGLTQSGLELLEGLFLINVIEYQELPRYIPNENSFRRGILNTEYHPATFAGSVHVGRYGRDSKGRKIPLIPSNFIRVPATRCPDPPKPAE